MNNTDIITCSAKRQRRTARIRLPLSHDRMPDVAVPFLLHLPTSPTYSTVLPSRITSGIGLGADASAGAIASAPAGAKWC